MNQLSGGAARDPAAPRLSVVVPVHDGAAMLERCLQALRGSEDCSFECIVVDDGSTEPVAALAARYDATVLRLDDRGGPAGARNRGASLARADVLVFLDADVCVHPDTLRRIDRHLSDHPGIVAVMGSYDDHPTETNLVSQYKNLLHHYVHQNSRSEAWTFWAGCGAVRRAAFLETGGFDESYDRPCVEDIELGFRLRRSGHRIDLDPRIQVTHEKHWTLRSLVRTDLRDRAVPWLLLMLRDRTLPRDLNVRLSHRISVALVWSMVAALIALLAAPAWWSWAICAVAGVGLIVLNLDLYGFFFRRRGLAFTLGAVPLHWLYYGYCGLAVALAVGAYLWRPSPPSGDRRPSSAVRSSVHG